MSSARTDGLPGHDRPLPTPHEGNGSSIDSGLTDQAAVVIGMLPARPTRRACRSLIGEPDDMTGAVIFPASRAGRYLTGAIIPVDGGLSTIRR